MQCSAECLRYTFRVHTHCHNSHRWSDCRNASRHTWPSPHHSRGNLGHPGPDKDPWTGNTSSGKDVPDIPHVHRWQISRRHRHCPCFGLPGSHCRYNHQCKGLHRMREIRYLQWMDRYHWSYSWPPVVSDKNRPFPACNTLRSYADRIIPLLRSSHLRNIPYIHPAHSHIHHKASWWSHPAPDSEPLPFP